MTRTPTPAAEPLTDQEFEYWAGNNEYRPYQMPLVDRLIATVESLRAERPAPEAEKVGDVDKDELRDFLRVAYDRIGHVELRMSQHREIAEALIHAGYRRPTQPGSGVGREIAALEELARKATPGPWVAEHNTIASHIFVEGSGWIVDVVNPHKDWHKNGLSQAQINTNYIAACSPDRILRILAAFPPQAGWRLMSDLGPNASFHMRTHLERSANCLALLVHGDGRCQDVIVERLWDSRLGTRYFVLPDVPQEPSPPSPDKE
jgi:hypothetical protein